jgi:hypothetical protein
MSDRSATLSQKCSKEELIVIHAMALRKKYRDQYEEAQRWRL